MEWKDKVDESCADEVEEYIIDDIQAGFLSDDEIFEECVDYIEDVYPDDSEKITEEEFLEIIKTYRNKYQNGGEQENFLKLDLAFENLNKRGIVALHCAGFTQSDGFDDCNEIATERTDNGEKVVGCCFYTMQDLGHILHKESNLFYFSFGNYYDKPTAVEIGQIIVEEFEAVGFLVKWDKTAQTKVAIQDMEWDKRYVDEE